MRNSSISSTAWLMRQEILGVERRRRWTDDEKLAGVSEIGINGATVADVARGHTDCDRSRDANENDDTSQNHPEAVEPTMNALSECYAHLKIMHEQRNDRERQSLWAQRIKKCQVTSCLGFTLA